jgi:hypothetical protein
MPRGTEPVTSVLTVTTTGRRETTSGPEEPPRGWPTGREQHMTRKVTVGILAAALLLSGGMVGISFGQADRIAEPEVIELTLDVCSSSCQLFGLGDPIFGHGEGVVALSRDPLFDADGTEIGVQRNHCVNWLCTYVVTLRDGQYTDRGKIVTTGIYRFSDPSTLAVTGGTGAYEGVGGYATLIDTDDPAVLTLHLTP